MTVVCLATGPSLSLADVERCRGQFVIAVKDAIRLAPWAQVLYACDAKWWKAHPETAAFPGLKVGLEKVRGRDDLTVLRNTGQVGLESEKDGLRTGMNSGYQAINYAVHCGASRIVLLGYDMQLGPQGEVHWFGNRHAYQHARGLAPAFALFLPHFPTLCEPLRALGIAVLNASRVTALTCFPRVSLEKALA